MRSNFPGFQWIFPWICYSRAQAQLVLMGRGFCENPSQIPQFGSVLSKWIQHGKEGKCAEGLIAPPGIALGDFPRFLWVAAALPGWFWRGFPDFLGEQLDLPMRVTKATQLGIDPTIGGWIVGEKINLKNDLPALVTRSGQERSNWTRKWSGEWNKVAKLNLDCDLTALQPLGFGMRMSSHRCGFRNDPRPCCDKHSADLKNSLLDFAWFWRILNNQAHWSSAFCSFLCFLWCFLSALLEKKPKLRFTKHTNN